MLPLDLILSSVAGVCASAAPLTAAASKVGATRIEARMRASFAAILMRGCYALQACVAIAFDPPGIRPADGPARSLRTGAAPGTAARAHAPSPHSARDSSRVPSN